MKLIVTGATGFVGSEVIRLALRHPSISTVVALARKPVTVPDDIGPNTDRSKFRSVVLHDWTSPYPEEVKEQIKGTDACIWTLAITPTGSKTMDFAEVTTICHDYTIAGITNMAAIANNPFRFIYTSGVFAERDQTKEPPNIPDYLLMRGRTESALLSFAAQHQHQHHHNNSPKVSVTITRPGGIANPPHKTVSEEMIKVLSRVDHAPVINVSDLAASIIELCLKANEKDPLFNEDLIEIAKGAVLMA